MRRIALWMLCLAALPLAGCFDVEQALTLEKDLSGKAAFNMKVNFEPMMLMMLQFKRSMEGKEGAPTAAEIEAARKEFLASRKTETKDPKLQEADLKKELPEGIRLLDAKVEEKGLQIDTHFLFGFDHISKLQNIDLPDENKEGAEAEAGPPGAKNPFDSPFGGLRLVDEGKTFLLTSETINPLAEQEEQTADMDLDPEMKKQIEDAFKGLRIAFKIDAPFEVVEHNATRKDGRTLVWEYDLKTLEKMKPEDLAQGVRVRFKK
jgi:hypothetical protein